MILLWLPAIFVLLHRPTGETVVKYEGQAKQDLIAMFEKDNLKYEFITEKKYNSWLKAHEAVPNDDARRAKKKTALADVRNQALTPAARLDALLILLDLDKR